MAILGYQNVAFVFVALAIFYISYENIVLTNLIAGILTYGARNTRSQTTRQVVIKPTI